MSVKELPRYVSHKIVHALKLKEITVNPAGYAFVLIPEDDDYGDIWLDWELYRGRLQYTDKDYGYYVVYEDGYTSWSPTKAFEEGYSPL